MMADNIRDIKRRIRSVNSTKQITKAMELVAASKLRKARGKAEQGKPYFEKMIETIQEIVEITGEIKNPFIEVREVKNKAIIVITGDRGLAGGYNSNAIKMGVEAIEEKEKASIVAVGSTGRDYYRRRDYKIVGEYIGVSETPSFSSAKEIGQMVMDLFSQEVVDEVYLVYTEFVSTISQKPRMIKLLPISYEKIQEEKVEDSDNMPPQLIMSYEPSAGGVLAKIIPKYVEKTIYGAMIESAASEQGARRMAMESATDNANDMIGELTLSYNRARQSAVTQEIAEIVGGAEALK